MNDLKYAFRQLLKSPGFTAVAVLRGILGGSGVREQTLLCGGRKKPRRMAAAFAAVSVAGLLVQSFSSGIMPVHAGELTAAEHLSSEQIESIVHGAAKTYMLSPQAVGLSLGLTKDGRSYVYNFGVLEPGKLERPTARTIYYIASVAKTFTSALLAQAAVEKKLKLDDDVRKYLDGEYPNLEFEGHPIRLYDLVNHRSGLPMFLPDRPDLLGGPDRGIVESLSHLNEVVHGYSRKEFFADLHSVKLDAIPGSRFKYSNAAGQLMSFILERVYRRSYEDLLGEKITRPLNMEDTAISLTESQRARYAKGFNEQGLLMPDSPHEFQGAGALKSTVSDMLKYLQWQAEETNTAVKLSHETKVTDGDYAVGLNWQIKKSLGARSIWQNGNVPGFSCYCIVSPELKLGLVVLTNEGDGAAPARIATMANQILKSLDSRYVPLD